jgi:hypothetical protein
MTAKIELPGLGRLAQVLDGQRFDKVIAKAAVRAVTMVQQVTPAKFFHQMVKSWKVIQTFPGSRTIINTYQTAARNGQRYLIADMVEYGTKNEGSGFIYPTPPKKRLFIPLTARAAMAYQTGSRRNLKYGVDYVLAVKAHGIKPRWFVRDVTPAVNDMVVGMLTAFLKDEVARAGL